MKQGFLLVLFAFSWAQVAKAVSFDYSMYNDQKEYKCQFKKCYALDEIVKELRRNSYDVRDKLQSLIQARLHVKVRMARLIPSFRLATGVAAGLSDYTAIPSLLGFLFPSNWFNWKESKLFYLAQRESYKTLLANQILTGVELFYILHKEFIETDIYRHYYEILEGIEEFFKDKIKRKESGITAYHLNRLLAFKSEAKIKMILLQNEFKDTFPLIANLMGMPIDDRWDQSSIELHKLPKLGRHNKKDQNGFYQKVIKLSPELKSNNYLIHAIDYSKKARIFSFLTSFASVDDALGAGYLSNIKIVKSEKKQLEIKKEKTASLLRVRVHAILLNYNAAIDTYNEAKLGRKSTKRLLKRIFKNYEETKKIDIEQLIEVMYSALGFDLARNFSQHYFFANKNHFDRMMFQGKYFEGIDELVPKKKKLDDLASLRKAREERKIEKAIREGKLKI